ncbi:MAG: 16S rRNA (guanine(527)-N(7))-methyltransferase RsmG [Candidatus Hinthialibacter antarcticus]|nr:16S rRNA (guanine(527)-N(7))-methyltransferase RsmG [Candidatus Hinthialibacter antarcticus]
MDESAYLRAFEAHLNKRNIQIEPAASKRCGLYFYLIHVKNQSMNLTRYDSPADAVDYHLLDALAINQALSNEPIESLIDVGSGAGVPGVLLNCISTDMRLCVLDSVKKKMDFVASALEALQLGGSSAVSARAEDLGHDPAHREQYDCATARALGTQAYCLELCAPFVKTGGGIALLRSDEDLIHANNQYAETLGCLREKVLNYQLPGREKAFRIEIYRKNAPTADKYPRKPGKIKKRPL